MSDTKTLDEQISEANTKLNDLITKWQAQTDKAIKKDYKIAVNFQELRLENLQLKKQINNIVNDLRKLAEHL
ncbi:MAG: hypothetical protein LBQ34_02915 [Alphaproteobacteria bacterium]|jgi:hypothetical protein|nr:hypothetical protein [Alphaproteobacteria bacterium]